MIKYLSLRFFLSESLYCVDFHRLVEIPAILILCFPWLRCHAGNENIVQGQQEFLVANRN